MHPVDRGRFCDSCSKVVKDFSQMTDKEIGIFLKSKPKNACGRFRTNQVNKTYTSQRNIAIPAHKRLIRCVMSVFLIGSAAKEAKSQSQDTLLVQSDSLYRDSLALSIESIPSDSINDCTENIVLADTTISVNTPEIVLVNVEWEAMVLEGMTTSGLMWVETYPVFDPEMPIPMLDTVAILYDKIKRKIKRDVLAVEEERQMPRTPENHKKEQKSEAVLPSFFSLRDRNSGESKKS